MYKIKAVLHFLFVETPFFITGGLEMIILLNRKVVGHSYEVKRFKVDRKKRAISALERIYKK